MSSPFITVLILAIILIVLDFIYLSVNRSIFEHQIVKIQRTALIPNMVGVVLCYIFIVLGLYYFIVRTHRPPFDAFLLGLFVYGVYELTNYSIFKKWCPKMVAMDTLWGGVLFFLSTYFVYKMGKFL